MYFSAWSSAQEEEKKKKKKKNEEQSFADWSDENYPVEEEEDIAPVKTSLYNPLGIDAPLDSIVRSRVQTEEEKKAEAEERETWFKSSSLFDDGWDVGDVSKTILASAGDAIKWAATGIVGGGEKLLDAAMTVAPYFAQGMYYANGGGYNIQADRTMQFSFDTMKAGSAEFVKKDLYDEEEVVDKVLPYDVEDESVLGKKSDALAQSAGQLAAQIGANSWLPGVGMALMGATAFGSEAENALRNGATLEEAALSGLISAGAEMLTEKISGGIKFGGKTADELLTKRIASTISNKTVRVLAKAGLDMAGEGAEEIVSGYASAIGQKLTYMEDKEISELFSSEDALDSFIGGFILGGSGNVTNNIVSNIKGVDSVTGNTKNEQAVIDKELEKRIAKEEENGEKLSGSEKSKIYDEVVRDMERGYISTDTIEEVLGDKSSYDSLAKEAEEFDSLYNTATGNLSKAQQNRLAELEAKNKENPYKDAVKKAKDQYSQSVREKIKGDRLVESYLEKNRVYDDFQADLTKYKGTKHEDAAKKTIENAIKAGANNTNRVHDMVDMLAKSSADTGKVFTFKSGDQITAEFIERQTNEIDKLESIEQRTAEQDAELADMKELLEQVKNGDVVVDGDITADGIVLNLDSNKPLNRVVGHEITHSFEPDKGKTESKEYAELRDSLFTYAKTKGIDIDSELKSRQLKYKGVANANAEAELVADLVGDFLFTDSDYVKRLSVENRNVFQKMWDEIKYLCKIATAGSKEARELEKVKKAFEDAYRESAEKNTADGGVNGKFSLENGSKRKYNKRSRYSETETLFLSWENGSAPVGEVKKFVRYGKTHYYEKTESGCVELSRSQYNERNGAYVENIDGRAERRLGTTADYDESAQRGTIGHSDGYRDTSRNATVFGQAIRERLSDDTAGSVSSAFGHDSGTDINQSKYSDEASDESDASFVTFSNDYATIRNFMKDGDVSKSKDDVQYSLSNDNQGKTLYTGSPVTDIKQFKVGGANGAKQTGDRYGRGIYLTTNKTTAQGYAGDSGRVYEINADDLNIFDLNDSITEEMKATLARELNGKDKQFRNSILRSFRSEKTFTDFESAEKFFDEQRKVWKEEDGYYSANKPEILSADDKTGEAVIEYTDFVNIDNAIGNLTGNQLYDALKSISTDDFASFITGHGFVGIAFDEDSDNQQYVIYRNEDRLQITNDGDVAPTKYSLTDSSGGQLSKEQQEFFKDSKVRDENGNLKVMYHGSQESFTVFDKKKARPSGYYGKGFYFTDSNSHAKQYGSTYEVYLNITNPIQNGTNDITKEQLRKFVEAIAENEDYGIDNYGERATVDSVTNSVYGKGDFAMLMDINASCVGDLVEAVELFNEVNGTDYDGIVAPTETVAFYPEQIKRTDNKAPTSDPDIRHSLSNRGEEFAPSRNDFFGKDFRKKSADDIATEDDIAPVAEDVNPSVENVTSAVYDAPVAETVDAESVMVDRDSFMSQKAMELYKEITSLKKGVRASKSLGYLLDHGHEWRSIKTALLNIRDNPNQVVNPNSAAETVAREMLGREYDDMVAELAEPSDVAESIRNKMKHIQTEIANNERLRAQSNADYDSEIAEVQAEYDAKKNKNTIVANDLLRRIERLTRMKNTNDDRFAKRIGDLEARIEKMRQPTYKTAVQRKAKHDEYTNLMKNLVGDTTHWVDKKLGISYKVNTLRRNLRDVVRDANGNRDIAKADAIDDELHGKYNHNEADLKRESRLLKSPFAELNPTHAEETYAHMLGEFRHNPDSKLTEEVVKEYYEKHKNKIDTEKVDKYIEGAIKTFDDLFVRLNERLREQGMKEIPYRKGYFPHFTNPKQGVIAKLFNWKTVDTEIPTSIAGLTETFNPERSWQGFSKQRKGDTTDYNLAQALDTYIHGALDWIYHIEDIQKRRALENYIRYIHSEEGVKARIDAINNSEELDADEAQKQIDAVYAEAKNPLNNFVADLRAGTNTLANKKSSLDRGIEEKTNRKIYSVMTNLNNRINANMVVGSFSSALTNFIPITQSWMEVSPVYSLRGMKDTIKSTIRDDGMVNKSDFLTNRFLNEENLYQTFWDKASDKAAFMMEAIDSFTSQTVWRSKYLQNISEGMSETEAIKNADQFAENVIAGRSRGNMPTIFDAKNPITKIFTAFQLEVNNQYGYMFKDAPQDSKNKARLIKGYATAFLGAYAYNALYSSLVGRDAAFDPISILEDLFRDMGLFGDDEEEEPEDILVNLRDNILEEVPFIGGLMGGGRIPISSALPYSGEYEGLDTFLKDVSEGNKESIAKEMLKPLYYLVMPFGGGQIKKTNEGLSMFSDDHPIAGSYTDSGNLRFPVEDTIGNRIQAGLFGQYASENARDYFDNGRQALKEKQIEEFIDVDIPIRDYWEYREGLADQETIEDKFDYIAGLDLPVSKKNILINNVVDREEEVDLEGYEDFSSYDEFDFATKNPGKYAISQAVGGFDSYSSYMDVLGDIEADKDENGKSISGSKKEKVIRYIESLGIDYGMKIILFKSMYDSKEDRNNYNADIVEYLNSRDDISYDEMVTILTELGMRVSGNNVYWD